MKAVWHSLLINTRSVLNEFKSLEVEICHWSKTTNLQIWAHFSLERFPSDSAFDSRPALLLESEFHLWQIYYNLTKRKCIVYLICCFKDSVCSRSTRNWLYSIMVRHSFVVSLNHRDSSEVCILFCILYWQTNVLSYQFCAFDFSIHWSVSRHVFVKKNSFIELYLKDKENFTPLDVGN